MTDLEKLENTLKEFDIYFEVGKFYNKFDEVKSVWLSIGGWDDDQYVEFDLEGKFIK